MSQVGESGEVTTVLNLGVLVRSRVLLELELVDPVVEIEGRLASLPLHPPHLAVGLIQT